MSTGLAPRGVLPATPRSPRRRWFVWALVLPVVLAAGTLVGWRHPGAGATCRPAIVERALSRLANFQDWLQRNSVQGYVGEVGWPGNSDAAQWNAVADAWYAAADRDRLWVSAWAAGQWWPPSYTMANYRFADAASGPVTAGPQTKVVEAHLKVAGALRGIDLPTGAFSTGDDGNTAFSNSNPGVYNRDYRYDDAQDYRYLAQRGYQFVRLSVSWERLQPVLGARLNHLEVSRLRTSITAAAQAGLRVILDLHNFGGYWAADAAGTPRRLALGSPALPVADFADFWARVSGSLRAENGVLGYGLMNEPRRLATSDQAGARIWEAASQSALTAIRATGDTRMILVGAYDASAPENFSTLHPRAWINDPAHAVRYEMHQYFDADGSGLYARSYAQDERSVTVANAHGQGTDSCAQPQFGGVGGD